MKVYVVREVPHYSIVSIFDSSEKAERELDHLYGSYEPTDGEWIIEEWEVE